MTTGVDVTTFLTLPLLTLDRIVGLEDGTLDELFTLAASFSTYEDEYRRIASKEIERISGETLGAVNRMRELASLASAATSRAFYESPSPDVFAITELVAGLNDSIEHIVTIPSFMGVEVGVDGSPVQGTVSYQVRQGDTLEYIALNLLGDPEGWIVIARFNDIDIGIVGASVPLDLWVGKILNIPAESVATGAKQDPSVLDAPIGVRALGTNFPAELTSTVRGDGAGVELTVLEPTNTLLEGLSIRLETPIGTVIDFPEFGSYVPFLLGHTFGEMTDRILQVHLQASLYADPRVADVVNFSLKRDGTGVTVMFQLKLFNGITTPELWASYTPGDVNDSL